MTTYVTVSSRPRPNAFFAAELGDAVLVAQAFEDDADFLLGRPYLAG